MKHRMSVIMFAIFLVGLLVFGAFDAQAKGCSNASFKGGYVIAANGVMVTTAGMINITRRSFACVDGKGNFTDGKVDNWDGTVLTSRIVIDGTYTVNADCTATASINLADGTVGNFMLTVAKDKSVDFMAIDPGIILRGVAKPSGTKLCSHDDDEDED